MKKLLIHGATGYTGRMAAERAAAGGTPLILAGDQEGIKAGGRTGVGRFVMPCARELPAGLPVQNAFKMLKLFQEGLPWHWYSSVSSRKDWEISAT